MNINDLMIREIRAEVDFNDEKIIIKNPKGDIKTKLLKFFGEQLEKNMDNSAINKKGRKKKVATDVEIFTLLMNDLTNIEIDDNDIKTVLENPSYELSVVMLYLASIMQELIFETISQKNLEIRMQTNTLLEKNTLGMVNQLEDVIKEIKHRKLIENGENIQ